MSLVKNNFTYFWYMQQQFFDMAAQLSATQLEAVCIGLAVGMMANVFCFRRTSIDNLSITVHSPLLVNIPIETIQAFIFTHYHLYLGLDPSVMLAAFDLNLIVGSYFRNDVGVSCGWLIKLLSDQNMPWSIVLLNLLKHFFINLTGPTSIHMFRLLTELAVANPLSGEFFRIAEDIRREFV